MTEEQKQDVLCVEEKGNIHDRKMQDYSLACQLQRPFMLLRPKIYPDGNQWCVLLGDNIQEGLAGFGDTPDEAASDFDQNWGGQKLKVGKA